MFITDSNYRRLASSQVRKPTPKVLINDVEVDIISLEFYDPRETFVGGFSSKYIILEIADEELPEGATTVAPFMLFKGSSIEAPIGLFNIESSESEYDEIKNVHTITAYDDSFLFDFKASHITFPSTPIQILRQISLAVGVNLDEASLAMLSFGGQTLMGMNVSDDESISYRQIVSQLAQFNLCTAHIGRSGLLTFRNVFVTEVVDVINGDDYFELTIDKTIKPINSVVYEPENITDPIFKKNEASILEYGLTEFKIIGNVFYDSMSFIERQTQVNLMFGVMDGFVYHSFETDQVMRPDYDSCDVVNIVELKDVAYKVILSDIHWAWISGGLRGSMSCPVLPETITDYTLAGPQQELNNMGIRVDRINKKIVLEVSEIKKEIQDIELTPGPIGPDGKPVYTWIKYADTPTTGMDDNPTDKKYIGMAFNKTTATESTSYGEYQWSLMPQNITVGGRNYYSPTMLKNWANASNVIAEGSNWKSFYAKVIPGEVYSLSRESVSNNRFDISFFESEPELGMPIMQFWNHRNDLKVEGFTVPDGMNYIFVYITNQNDDIPKIKLEKGDIATDWTPAPEDVQAELDDNKNKIEDVEQLTTENTAQISLNSQSIQQEIIERTTQGELIVEQTSSLVQQTADDLNVIFSKLEAAQDLTNGEIELIQSYFRINENGVIIGKSNSAIEFFAENNRVGFRENGNDIAYWEEGTMHVDRLIAVTTIMVGYHLIEKYDSPVAGNTTIVKIGD